MFRFSAARALNNSGRVTGAAIEMVVMCEDGGFFRLGDRGYDYPLTASLTSLNIQPQ